MVLNDKIEVDTKLSKRAKYTSTILEHWWKRWRDDYLTELREYHKLKSRKRSVDPKVEDIVLIADDKLKRSEWREGRITELIVSKDDKVRSAALITKNKGTILRRPISKLFPIV